MKELTNEITIFFNRLKKRGTILHPSIPILYYGDYLKYQRSNPRVITVGLNPSYHEFPSDSPYIRFQGAEVIDFSDILNEDDFNKYLGTLNNYFKIDPYDWFDSYDRILNGLNTSYYPNTIDNNAIHTNLCSTFATEQTWSKLRNSIQYTLSREGRKVWHRLVELLEPDMILCSINSTNLCQTFLPSLLNV